MVASIPLIVAGYPMVSIDLDQRAEHEGIRRVNDRTAHGSSLSMMAHSGLRGRSRTADEIFRWWHAENPRTYSIILARGSRNARRPPSEIMLQKPACALKFRPRRHPSFRAPNLTSLPLANGAPRHCGWLREMRGSRLNIARPIEVSARFLILLPS